MEQITLSILTLFALYILYSECIKLPPIIKKNKTLAYLVVGVSYLCFYNNIEGLTRLVRRDGAICLHAWGCCVVSYFSCLGFYDIGSASVHGGVGRLDIFLAYYIYCNICGGHISVDG